MGAKPLTGPASRPARALLLGLDGTSSLPASCCILALIPGLPMPIRARPRRPFVLSLPLPKSLSKRWGIIADAQRRGLADARLGTAWRLTLGRDPLGNDCTKCEACKVREASRLRLARVLGFGPVRSLQSSATRSRVVALRAWLRREEGAKREAQRQRCAQD